MFASTAPEKMTLRESNQGDRVFKLYDFTDSCVKASLSRCDAELIAGQPTRESGVSMIVWTRSHEAQWAHGKLDILALHQASASFAECNAPAMKQNNFPRIGRS